MTTTEPETPGGLSRRRVLAYLVAAPTLTLVAKVGTADPAGATPGVPDLFDLSDALTGVALPTAYLLRLEITPEGRVVLGLPRAEVGQGITTAFAQIVADELDARLDDVDVELDPARPELLFNQLTGGSNSIHSLYGPMRTVAAAARARLVTAASQRWRLSAGSLRTEASAVVAPDGRTLSFGALTEAAAAVVDLLVPGTPKPDAQLRLNGQPTGRIDARDIVTGRARYALDVEVAGALPTVVARPPTIKGTVRSVDATAARAMPGVIAVTPIPTGVAVTAETFHQAQAATQALAVQWGPGTIDGLSDADIFGRLRRATAPFVTLPLGRIALDRTFEFAFAPHAPMETLTATADVRGGRAEVWYAAKSPIVAAQTVAAAIGLPQDAVTLHVVRGGGSFGHRLFFEPAVEAAQVSKAIGRPVRLMWTRNDDMRHGRLRPASHHKVRATHLFGSVVAYEHRHATLPVDFSHGFGDALSGAGFDVLNVGATQTVFQLTQKVAYDFGVETQLLTDVQLDVNTGSWRSIYSGQTSTVNEIMVDEIARAFRRDPLGFRRDKLSSPRARAVLNRVGELGRWGRAMPAGTAQGVAVHEEYKSVVAYLVEIDCRDRAHPRVTKGVCAVDVGRAVNPTGLRAQMQGALMDGCSTILSAGVHIDRGAVREGSFADYHYARQAQAPTVIDVHVMPPTGPPGGAGELGVPAAAAAVANAYARATGTLPTRFPIAFG
ncbi:MAG TPA: molybdopterin cofactor-binding domain-containing protein [Iamia sp.]